MVMECYGKVMENSKNSEFHGNLFARKKSHGKVMEISCVVINVDLDLFLGVFNHHYSTTLVLYLYLECHVGGVDGCKGRRPLFCNIYFSEQ